MGIINQPSRILQVTHLVKWGYIHGLCSHGATATNDEETALDEHVLATWHCSSLTRVCSFAAPMLGSQALEDWGPQRSHEQDPRSIPCQTSEVRVRLLWMVLRASRGLLGIDNPASFLSKHDLQVILHPPSTPAPAISFKRSGCHTCSCLSVDPDSHIRSSTWPRMKVRCWAGIKSKELKHPQGPAAAVDVAGMEDAGGRYRLLSHKDFVEELRDQWPCKSWL